MRGGAQPTTFDRAADADQFAQLVASLLLNFTDEFVLAVVLFHRQQDDDDDETQQCDEQEVFQAETVFHLNFRRLPFRVEQIAEAVT